MTDGAGAASPFADRHVLLIVAHQDDEVLGAGAQFPSFGQLSVLHVTNGAGFMPEARAKGFPTLQAYAAARAREVRSAVATAGVEAIFHTLGIRDLEATFHLASVVRQLVRAINGIGPDIILTHPYEGGHPDHDAVAFGVQRAVRQLAWSVPVWEFTSYHREGGVTVHGKFLPNGDAPLRLELTEAQRDLKRRMLERFVSQHNVVAEFPLDAESFRPAPGYDFAHPPHTRPLGYELQGWGMPASLWLTAAQQVLREQPSWRMAVRLRWEMWTRRFHPDRPRVVRLMRAVPLLARRVW